MLATIAPLNSAMDATNSYDDSIDALLDENISDEDF
jgi:hypothetical protein